MLILIIIINILIVIFYSVLWRKKIGSGISPTALYGFIWGCIWIIHEIGIIDYYPISNIGLIYSFIPLISMCFAESFLMFYNKKKEVYQLPKEINRNIFRRWVLFLGILTLYSGIMIFIASLIIFGKDWMLLGIGSQVKELRITEGLSMYTAAAFEGTIFAGIVRYIDILQGASYGAIVLAIFYLKIIDHRYWIGILLPIVGSILYDIGNMSRSYTYNMILFLIAFQIVIPLKINYLTQKNKLGKVKRNVKLYAFVALLCIIILYFLTNINKENMRDKIGKSRITYSVEQYINYHAGNLVTFDKTLDQNSLTYGRMSFYSVEFWLRFFNIISRSERGPQQLWQWEYEYPEIHQYEKGGLNTYSWLRYLYSDYGILGLFIIPFSLVFIAIICAIKYKESSCIRWLALLSICYIAILRSPTIMLFRDPVYSFGLILLLISSIHIDSSS